MSETPVVPRHPGETFNVDDWLQDAELPTESALVYKRPDVIAELSELKREIELEERVAQGEQTAADTSRVGTLMARYEELLHRFSGSGLTVYVRAITDDERDEIRAAHDARTKDWDPKKANEHFGFDLLARAITHVKPAGGEKVAVTFTPDQVTAMERAIGNVQMKLVLAARQTAQNALPAVDADFLRRPSGEGTGQE